MISYDNLLIILMLQIFIWNGGRFVDASPLAGAIVGSAQENFSFMWCQLVQY